MELLGINLKGIQRKRFHGIPRRLRGFSGAFLEISGGIYACVNMFLGVSALPILQEND